MSSILKQPHLTVRHMHILTVLFNFYSEVKHIPGVKSQIADALSCRTDFPWERCNLRALEVTAAGEWVDDINAGIIDDEWFRVIAHCFANPSPRPLPSTASTKERKIWVAAQRFYVQQNGLLWLRGDLEKTQVNKSARAKEKEEDGKADMRGWFCIPGTMQQRILHEAPDSSAGGYFGPEQTYLRMNDRYFWRKMWRDTQRYVSSCDLCNRTSHQSGKPIGLLQPVPIGKGRWQRIGIDIITNLPMSGNGHDCIAMFVEHMTKRAHWRACKKTIEALAFAHIFFDNIVLLHGVPQEVESDPDVCFTAVYWREVGRILQTKLLMSTAFHPETDGLSSHSNKMAVWYLCGFAPHHQAIGDDFLPLAEYAYNSLVHRSTKQTLFELNLGYEPLLPLDSNCRPPTTAGQ